MHVAQAVLRYFTLYKMIEVFITFKSLTRKKPILFKYINVPDSVLSHIHFTDSEYINWFTRYKPLCELWYFKHEL